MCQHSGTTVDRLTDLKYIILLISGITGTLGDTLQALEHCAQTPVFDWAESFNHASIPNIRSLLRGNRPEVAGGLWVLCRVGLVAGLVCGGKLRGARLELEVFKSGFWRR